MRCCCCSFFLVLFGYRFVWLFSGFLNVSFFCSYRTATRLPSQNICSLLPIEQLRCRCVFFLFVRSKWATYRKAIEISTVDTWLFISSKTRHSSNCHTGDKNVLLLIFFDMLTVAVRCVLLLFFSPRLLLLFLLLVLGCLWLANGFFSSLHSHIFRRSVVFILLFIRFLAKMKSMIVLF